MKRKGLIICVLIVLAAGGAAWLLIVNAPPSNRKPAPEPEQQSGLVDPAFHSERVISKAENVLASPTPSPSQPFTYQTASLPVVPEKQAPLRMYTSTTPEATPAPAEEHHGHRAQSGRLVRCKLVNTVDSSNISTPIIGMVTDDVLSWDGHIIIPKCSEVHGIAQVDKARERIASEGAFIFVLHDDKTPGREMVVKGEVLDREDDPQFQSYGITNGSAGLRGVVITKDSGADLKLFVATFISGIAGGLENTQNTIFGPVASPNGSGVGGLSGAVINPVAGGAQAVLDRYAQTILDGIERDGFFIRCASSSTFYVYCREPLDSAKATVGGSSRLSEVQESFLQDRKLEERVTQPRAVRDEQAARSSQTSVPTIPLDPGLSNLTNRLDQTSELLGERSRELGVQSQSLVQPSPFPAQ